MSLSGSKLTVFNLLLIILLAAVAARYAGELSWALEQIDDYRQGYIESPLERELYLEGRDLLYEAGEPDAAMALLRESIRIDPNTDAGFLLAESFRAKGDLPRAALEYERFLDIDYLHIRARLALIETYRSMGKTDLVRQTAQEGVTVFGEMIRKSSPEPDPVVEKRFNYKARKVYRRYERARDQFEKLAR